jgi:hypothetical protein
LGLFDSILKHRMARESELTLDPAKDAAPDLRLFQKATTELGRRAYQRTQDVIHPTVLYSLTVAVGTGQNQWLGPIKVNRPSTLQLLSAGVAIAHPIYSLPTMPSDVSVPTGQYINAPGGLAYFLQVGEWYIYIPNQAGDPASFNALLSDASSELPAQQNALAAGGGAATPSGAVVNKFDTSAANESAFGQYVRAALTGQDLAAAAGAKNVPISADLLSNVPGRLIASTEALYTISLLAGLGPGGTSLSAAQIIAALTADSYVNNRIRVDAACRFDDGATYSVPATRGAITNQANSLLRLLVDSVVRGQDVSGTNYAAISSDLISNSTGRSWTVEALYTASVMYGVNAGGTTLGFIGAAGGSPPINGNSVRGQNALNVYALPPASDQCIEATAAINTALTLTIPAPGANLRQYVNRLKIECYSGAAQAAQATPFIVTTTGIAGNPSFNFPSGTAQGNISYRDLDWGSDPIEASADNATITVVCPQVAGFIWKVTAWYRNR